MTPCWCCVNAVDTRPIPVKNHQCVKLSAHHCPLRPIWYLVLAIWTIVSLGTTFTSRWRAAGILTSCNSIEERRRQLKRPHDSWHRTPVVR